MTISPHGITQQPARALTGISLTGIMLTIGLGLMMERFGISDRANVYIAMLFSLCAVLGIAWASRTMVLTQYFAQSRSIGLIQSMAATGTLLLGACIIARPEAILTGPAIAAFWLVLLLIYTISGAGLRQSGAFSLRQWLCTRCPDAATRIMLSLILIVSDVILSASGLEASAHMLESDLSISPLNARIIVAVLTLPPVLAGGLNGVLILSRFTLVLTLAAFSISLILNGFHLPDLYKAILIPPESQTSNGLQQGVVFALGLASLPSLLSPNMALRTPAATGPLLRLFIWSGLLIAMFWPQGGFHLHTGELALQNAGIDTSLDSLIRLSLFMLCLNFSMATVQSCAANLTEGFTQPNQPFPALSSQRLARNRLALVCVVAACSLDLPAWHFMPKLGFQLVMGLHAAIITPIVALALWPRAQAEAIRMIFYISLATLGGTLIYDGNHPVLAHLLTAAIGGGLAALAGGIGMVLYRQKDQNT